MVPKTALLVSVKVMSSPAETATSVPPVVLPFASTSARVSNKPIWSSTYVFIANVLATLLSSAPAKTVLVIKLVPDIGPSITKAVKLPRLVIFG